VPIAKAPKAFDPKNTLRLVPFIPLRTTPTDLLDYVPPTSTLRLPPSALHPLICTTTLTR